MRLGIYCTKEYTPHKWGFGLTERPIQSANLIQSVDAIQTSDLYICHRGIQKVYHDWYVKVTLIVHATEKTKREDYLWSNKVSAA